MASCHEAMERVQATRIHRCLTVAYSRSVRLYTSGMARMTMWISFCTINSDSKLDLRRSRLVGLKWVSLHPEILYLVVFEFLFFGLVFLGLMLVGWL